MLQLNNNYATRTLPGATIGATFGGPLTMVCTFRTKATTPAGGIYAAGSTTISQCTGIKIGAGNILEAGMLTVAGTMATLLTLSPNTLYTVVLTRDNAGNTSATVNGGSPVTKSVSPGSVTYDYLGVGTFRANGVMTATALVDVAHAALYRRILTSDEIAAYHAKNLSAIATTNQFDYHSLISDLDSDAGGTALVMNTGAASFDNFDPFAALYTVTNINGGNPVTYGQAVTWTAAGFSPDTATVDGVAASVVSASGMTLPALIDGQTAPRPGSRAVVASEGANSANATTLIEPPTGFQYVQLTTQTTEDTRVTPEEAEPDDHWMVETKDNTIAYANGTLGTNHVGSVLAWLIKDDTSIAGQYEIIFGEGGEYIETRKTLYTAMISPIIYSAMINPVISQ